MTDLEIVQEAQKIIEKQIYKNRTLMAILTRHDEIYNPDKAKTTYAAKNLNSWLAHKAFFERHKPHDGYNGVVCLNCYRYNASYPCPELVAQAKAIMGVTE
jgi:hypothetical protein